MANPREYESMTQQGMMAKSRDDARSIPQLSVVKQTAFSAARDTFNEVHRLEARIDSIVNSLVGAVSEETCENKPCAPSNGILEDLSDRARSAASAISRIDATLSRLERELP